MRDVLKYLTQMEGSSGEERGQEFASMMRLYNNRLWHQLTVQVLAFAKNPQIQKKGELIDLYDNFVSDFEMRMNPLSLAEFSVLVSQQYEDANDAVNFIEKIEPKVKASPVSLSLCKVTRGEFLLKLKDIKKTKDLLDEIEEHLREVDGVTVVHGRFYLLKSEVNKIEDETANYYRSALKFLGCTPLTDLSTQQQSDHARELAIAALIGEDIYNFGELLAHPILASLNRTTYSWLIPLLQTFNEGDISKFEELGTQWKKDKRLKDNEESLRVKLTILCLMEMTFKRKATDRTITFDEIARETKLNVNEVEIYVMKAIAKGLLKGRIDEIGRRVQMTWVQPRVLNRAQIGNMVSRLDAWKEEIRNVEEMMEKDATDILLL